MPLTRPISAPPPALLAGVTKRFGDLAALDGVTLELAQGEVTALLGPNGAGKTTAVRCFLGLTRPSEGRATVYGGDPRDSAGRVRTGAMMQVSSVPETLKVREHIHLFSSYYPAPLPVADVVAAAGLEGLEETLYGKLSGGQQQRLRFALAVCGDPDLLFLDEPTVGLDVTARRAFWEQIRGLVSRGRTVLLTTHYLEEADSLADRIVVIDHGRIVADGTPSEIKARTALRRIRCASRLSLDEVRSIEGVRQVRNDGAVLEILSSSAEAVVQRMFGQDPSLTGLEITGAGLEEAFLALTDDSPATAAGAEKGVA